MININNKLFLYLSTFLVFLYILIKFFFGSKSILQENTIIYCSLLYCIQFTT